MDEALDLLMTTGFRKPVANLTISDHQNLSATLLDYSRDQYKVPVSYW